ncbi:glutamine ABC transporter, periplasmic, glutamine-binding protein [Pandoraea thiooxydans]|uniref:Amino acid ABC transporter substrate-binding protein n=1 Tax=Pandoraea thiooxydans TaxID=445709 RepID=A0A0G3EW88_9BURK|nr:transporter substrate-binding domain-containing protein [Pandoraea thiooxydans]AKJ68986.1 amino acid ABC transporter substrate-binding protein [Pandoraea thiooxydans]APR96518.1 glutamine ABC transporter, periplasmic, glutamine-binding protein [Pandoraea thiooxydans]
MKSFASLHSLFGALLAAACLMAPLAHADQLASIKHAGVLRVAVPQDFPPFGTIGPDLKPQGYDIDTGALIAKGLGVKLELIPVKSDNRIPYLTTGKADLIISSLGKSPERAKVIDFSDPYAPFFNGVFGPADMAIGKPADLAGKTVGVTRGAVEDLELTKVAPASTTIQRFEDNDATISAYLSGQVPLIATGNVVAATINGRDPKRRLETKFLMKDSPCYVGVNKNEGALMAAVNKILAQAKTDGALNRISEKWLHAPLPKQF